MDVRIRTAVPDDETRIRELYLEMLHAVFPGQEAEGYEEGYLDRFWAEQDDRIYVAEDDGVVAFLSVEVHDDPVRYVYLDDFSVTAGYRNKGIGTALIRKAEAYAEEKEASAVLLHVEKTNTQAMRFYKRLGYSEFRDDGNRLLLKKDIPQ